MTDGLRLPPFCPEDARTAMRKALVAKLADEASQIICAAIDAAAQLDGRAEELNQ